MLISQLYMPQVPQRLHNRAFKHTETSHDHQTVTATFQKALQYRSLTTF